VKKNILAVIVFAVLLSIFGSAVSVYASPSYERLFYFREGPNARKSFFAHPASIDVFAPQSYEINKEAHLVGSIKKDLLDFAEKNKIKVMPLLTNGAFSATTSRIFLDNPKLQDKLIDNLIAEAKDFGYWGWQIDFEQMNLSYREEFSAFVERAYQKFQQNNLKLSVAVIAQISENPVDYPNNLWERIIGVYDYARLSSSTDFISIMSYDDPYSKGPVTGYIWLNEVIVFSLTKIPADKISLGLGLYYWQWRDLDSKRTGIGGAEGINNVLNKRPVTFHYDEIEQAPYFHYWSGVDGRGYTIWYENAKSVAKKISLIKANKLRGFSAWALGLELPSVYTSMK
jgi:spore germination protein YaaH